MHLLPLNDSVFLSIKSLLTAFCIISKIGNLAKKREVQNNLGRHLLLFPLWRKKNLILKCGWIAYESHTNLCLPLPFFPPLLSDCSGISLQLEEKWFCREEQKPLEVRHTGSFPQLCNHGAAWSRGGSRAGEAAARPGRRMRTLQCHHSRTQTLSNPFQDHSSVQKHDSTSFHFGVWIHLGYCP